MILPFKVIKVINMIALFFLLLGGYGLAVTGFLQVITALFFLITFPKNKLIYIYFGIVILFFSIWDRHTMDWLFIIPIGLIFFLTYIIYTQKETK
jgi:hypothetical protein